MEFVVGREAVIERFGRWPTFHDAEVLAFGYERTEAGFDIRTTIHHWETSGEVDAQGCHIRSHWTATTFLFVNCDEERTSFDGFNGQNVLFGLRMERGAGPVRIEFEGCYGLAGTTACEAVRIVASEPFTRAPSAA